METCNNCGMQISDKFGYCDGVMSWEPDPFQEEIHGDYTLYWSCAGVRYESLMDI